MDEVEKMNNQRRLENAFSVAEEHLHVQKLLEPSGNQFTCQVQDNVGRTHCTSNVAVPVNIS